MFFKGKTSTKKLFLQDEHSTKLFINLKGSDEAYSQGLNTHCKQVEATLFVEKFLTLSLSSSYDFLPRVHGKAK